MTDERIRYYSKLLTKYMRHIEQQEGTFYLSELDEKNGFTDEDKCALERIAEEILTERKSRQH